VAGGLKNEGAAADGCPPNNGADAVFAADGGAPKSGAVDAVVAATVKRLRLSLPFLIRERKIL
jgi:hypothetical protein